MSCKFCPLKVNVAEVLGCTESQQERCNEGLKYLRNASGDRLQDLNDLKLAISILYEKAKVRGIIELPSDLVEAVVDMEQGL